MTRLILVFLTAQMLTGFAAGTVPAERFERLQRGVNLSHWYAQSRKGYDAEHLGSYVTENDARLIKEMGFRHVRFTLNDQVLFNPDQPGALRKEELEKFIERLNWFRKAELAVVVDLHPEDTYKEALLVAGKAEGFVKDWAALAEQLSEVTSPDWVFFEILNEPHHLKGDDWQTLQGRVLEAIRDVAPQHTVVVTGGGWGGNEELLRLTPYADKNTVYSFHWYKPVLFTHQAAGWGWEATRPVGQLGWPLEPDQADKATAVATRNKDSAGHLRWAISEGTFRREWIGEQMEAVERWAQAHGGLSVYVGEFGVYQKAAPREARLAWYAHCRKEFEKRGWGWAIWDYAGGFSVVQEKNGRRVPDQEMLTALGLR